MGGKQKTKDQHTEKQVGFRLSPEERQALNEMADRERRTLNEVITFALWFYAKEHNHPWPENPRAHEK